MPTWPGTLPQFIQSGGYSESLPQLTVESQVDSGQTKVRRRFTSGFRPLQMTIHCTPAQVAAFETFWFTDCAAGSIDFDWKNPRTQATASFRWRNPPPAYRDLGGGNVAISFNVWQRS